MSHWVKVQTNWTWLYQIIRRRLRSRRFLRDSGLLLLANVIVVTLSLVRTPAMTWMLPKEQFGMMGVVAAWLPFLQLLSLPGMDTASYHYIAKGHPWAFALNLSYRLRWSLLSLLGFILGALYWYHQGDQSLAWLFIITGLTYPVTIGLSAASGTLAARENFVALFWYRIWECLTDFFGFIPLLLSLWLVSQVVTFYALNQIATVIMQVGVSWWLLQQMRAQIKEEPAVEDVQGMIRYGQHQTGLSVISVFQGRADIFLISTFFPLTTMADYSIGTLATNQFRQLWSIYISVRYPPLARMDVAQRRRRFVLEGSVIFLGMIAAGVALILVSYWLIPLLLPPNYASSIPFIIWLTAIILSGMPGGIAETYFRTQQDHRRQYWMRTAGAITSILFPLALLIPWGVEGILLGRLASNILFSILGVWLFTVDKP
jgi:O-antigen/teichoic acid export membrane protein